MISDKPVNPYVLIKVFNAILISIVSNSRQAISTRANQIVDSSWLIVIRTETMNLKLNITQRNRQNIQKE